MRKGRTNNSKEQFDCTRRFCFARGSPPLKTAIVKFFAESDDVSYKNLFDALTKLLEYLQKFLTPEPQITLDGKLKHRVLVNV
jgi:hypothetical protein